MHGLSKLPPSQFLLSIESDIPLVRQLPLDDLLHVMAQAAGKINLVWIALQRVIGRAFGKDLQLCSVARALSLPLG